MSGEYSATSHHSGNGAGKIFYRYLPGWPSVRGINIWHMALLVPARELLFSPVLEKALAHGARSMISGSRVGITDSSMTEGDTKVLSIISEPPAFEAGGGRVVTTFKDVPIQPDSIRDCWLSFLVSKKIDFKLNEGVAARLSGGPRGTGYRWWAYRLSELFTSWNELSPFSLSIDCGRAFKGSWVITPHINPADDSRTVCVALAADLKPKDASQRLRVSEPG